MPNWQSWGNCLGKPLPSTGQWTIFENPTEFGLVLLCSGARLDRTFRAFRNKYPLYRGHTVQGVPDPVKRQQSMFQVAEPTPTAKLLNSSFQVCAHQKLQIHKAFRSSLPSVCKQVRGVLQLMEFSCMWLSLHSVCRLRLWNYLRRATGRPKPSKTTGIPCQ